MKPLALAFALLPACALAARAYQAEFSADPKFYREYFDLEKGDTLVRKVAHLGERIRADDDSDKRDKSVVGIRQKLNDLYASIEGVQGGKPDSPQSRMLKATAPAERALALSYNELREVAQVLGEGWKETRAAKRLVDELAAAHAASAALERRVLGSAEEIASGIDPGNARLRPSSRGGDMGADSALAEIAPLTDKINAAGEKLDEAARVMDLAGKKLGEAEGKIGRALPFAEHAGKVHAAAREALGGESGQNQSRAILADAVETARKSIGLARKLFTVMDKVQAETQRKLAQAVESEEAVQRAIPPARKAFQEAREADLAVRESAKRWDDADRNKDESGKEAAAAEALAAKSKCQSGLCAAKGAVASAAQAAAAAQPAKACSCCQKSASAALGAEAADGTAGAEALPPLGEFRERIKPGAVSGEMRAGSRPAKPGRASLPRSAAGPAAGVRFD